MQHTEKYKLNLIERDDVFSPDALNENTQKMEDAMEAHEAAVKEVTDGLDQRIAVFEAKHIVFGSYQGGSTRNIQLGFTPQAVLITGAQATDNANVLLLPSLTVGYGTTKIVEGGFTVGYNQSNEFCFRERTYTYMAIG